MNMHTECTKHSEFNKRVHHNATIINTSTIDSLALYLGHAEETFPLHDPSTRLPRGKEMMVTVYKLPTQDSWPVDYMLMDYHQPF